MLHKAELILERNKQRPVKENAKIKRLYNNYRSVKSLSTHHPAAKDKREVGEELFERMNKLT